MADFVVVMGIAAAAAVASPAGGLIAVYVRPTGLLMSISLGFAAGTLLGTICFKMLPEALQLSSLLMTVAGFSAGFLAVYGFDLYVHRGQIAGDKSEKHGDVKRHHRKHAPRGDEVTVLAGGTAAEELIEGISIGVGAAIQPGLGLLIAIAIVVDNLAEGLSIGELIREKDAKREQIWRIVGWTALIGVALFVSALLGWYFLQGLPKPLLGILLAVGGGGMLYLTVTSLVPESEERHYQQSAALAIGAGFLASLILANVL